MCAPINNSPHPSLSPVLPFCLTFFTILFYHLLLSRWLHCYLFNYFATTFSHFLFCCPFKTCKFHRFNTWADILTVTLWQSKQWNFFKNIHWVAIISDNFFVVTQVNVIHSFQFMNLMLLNSWVWNESGKVVRLWLLRKKSPYSELFWSVFSHIRTDYGEIKSRIRTRITPSTDTFHAVD